MLFSVHEEHYVRDVLVRERGVTKWFNGNSLAGTRPMGDAMVLL